MSGLVHITPAGILPCKANIRKCHYKHFNSVQEAEQFLDHTNTVNSIVTSGHAQTLSKSRRGRKKAIPRVMQRIEAIMVIKDDISETCAYGLLAQARTN